MSGGSSFPRQLAQASLVVFALVGGLYLLGQHRKTSTNTESLQRAERPSKSHAPEKRQARSLLPRDAWLVADFPGDLLEEAPFADASTAQDDPCRFVPAPERVAVALLPPQRGTSPEMMLAAPHVSDAFWNCAQKRVLAAGGQVAGHTERLEVLQSPSGVLARGPRGSLVFATSKAHVEVALALLVGEQVPSALTGAHAELAARFGHENDQPVIRLTVRLPPGWLTTVGPDADRSPLRHLQAAGLTADEKGSARGILHCAKEGCDELLSFARRVRADLVDELPGHRVGEALQLAPAVSDSAEATGAISLSWDGEKAPLLPLLSRFMPLDGFLGADAP